MTRPVLPHYWHRVAFPTLVAWPHYWASMTTLLAPCDLSHISGMVQSLLPHYCGISHIVCDTFYWHTFPTLVAWYSQYYHITGTVWHFPHKWHGTANITTLLAPCDLSHVSGMVRPVLPHYWHHVTIPTLVAWYSHYYHITGTVWHFPQQWHDTASMTTLLAPCGISHI